MRSSRILVQVVALVATVSLLPSGPSHAATQIEPFDGTLNFSTGAATGGTTVDHVGSIGGEMDVFIEQLTGSATVTAQNSGGTLTHTNGSGIGPFSISRLTLAWDGNDNDASALNPFGLAPGSTGINLTSGGGNAFRLSGMSVDLQATFVLSIFTGTTQVSTRTFTLTPTQPTPTLDVPFSSFVGSGPGGAADFGHVGAIQMTVTGGNFGLDFSIGDISVVPEPATAMAGALAVCGMLMRRAPRRAR